MYQRINLVSMLRYVSIFTFVFFFVHHGISQITNDYFKLNKRAGFFDGAFELTIESITNDEYEIKYTTDLSSPNATSPTYTDPITIDQTTVVKFKVFASEDTSQVLTYSYINIEELRQNQHMTHVSLDKLTKALNAIPIILVSGEQIDPVDPERVEVPVAAEFIWNDPLMNNHMINAGLQIWGDSPTNPKKNFRLEFKKKYGSKKFKADIFNNVPYLKNKKYIPAVSKFDKLLFRAGSQDGLNAEFSHELTPQYIRNRVMYDISLNADLLAPHGRFVHLFLNGQYWGHYHLMERPDEVFFEDYLDADKDNIEIFKSGEVWYKYHDQDTTYWEQMIHSHKTTTDTDLLKRLHTMDWQQAAKYLIFMGYCSGHDWGLTKNVVGYRDFADSSTGFQFMLYDIDFSLGNGGKWHPESASLPDFFNAPFKSSGPVPQSLLNNIDFKMALMDALQYLCIDEDGLLTPNSVKKYYLYRAKEAKISLAAEEARWGLNDYQSYGWHIAVDSWEVNEEWEKEKSRIIKDYIPKRTKALIQHFKDNLFLSKLKAVTYKIDTKKNRIKLKNPNRSGQIYYMLDGSDPREDGGTLSNDAVLYKDPLSWQGQLILKARVYDSKVDPTSIDAWSPIITKIPTTK